ncbi:MAG TPA: FAD-binding protein [bacterium]|nr:FAD-binding protein [bacterium]
MSSADVIEADVGVVGAGPGGMAAAHRLAAGGCRAVVLDEGARPGGQIFRQLPTGSRASLPEPPSHDRGHDLLQAFERSSVEIHSGCTVWDASPGRLWFEHRGRSRLLRCRHIVLAPGAYDRCIPFPGWTLPGVVTAGALQVMVRGFGVVPGRRALVVGSGPLLLPTVTSLLAAGVEVVAALEASSRWRALRALPGVAFHRARRREATWYLKQLWRAGVKLQWGRTVFACEGDGRVQRAIVGRVDREGRPIRGSEHALDVDVVGAGFGLVPSIELALRLGCATRYDAARGGHVVQVGAGQATDVDGVWAVGEVCGIGGAEVAIAEGELAAEHILAVRGGAAVEPSTRTRAREERRAADAMLRAFAPLPGLAELARPDTIVCRCEDVTRLTAQQAAELHGDTLRAIKLGCRAGMGPCQARICGPSLQAMATGDGRREMDRPVVQVPVKPVRSETIRRAPRGN